MWYTELLSNFLSTVVRHEDCAELIVSIEEIFESMFIYDDKQSNLETILHVLSYMVGIYKDHTLNDLPADQILDDFRFALLIAEKVTNDLAVWIVDFDEIFPEDRTKQELRTAEANFIQDKLAWDINYDLKNIIHLFHRHANSEISMKFKLHALHLKLQTPEADHHCIDRLIFHKKINQLIAKRTSKTPTLYSEATGMIKDKKSFEDMLHINATDDFIKDLQNTIDRASSQATGHLWNRARPNNIGQMTRLISERLEEFLMAEECKISTIFHFLIHVASIVEEEKIWPNKRMTYGFYHSVNKLLCHCFSVFNEHLEKDVLFTAAPS